MLREPVPAANITDDTEQFVESGMEVVIHTCRDLHNDNNEHGEHEHEHEHGPIYLEVGSLPMDDIVSLSQVTSCIGTMYRDLCSMKETFAKNERITHALMEIEDLVTLLGYGSQGLQQVFLRQQLRRCGLTVTSLFLDKEPDAGLLRPVLAQLMYTPNSNPNPNPNPNPTPYIPAAAAAAAQRRWWPPFFTAEDVARIRRLNASQQRRATRMEDETKRRPRVDQKSGGGGGFSVPRPTMKGTTSRKTTTTTTTKKEKKKKKNQVMQDESSGAANGGASDDDGDGDHHKNHTDFDHDHLNDGEKGSVGRGGRLTRDDGVSYLEGEEEGKGQEEEEEGEEGEEYGYDGDEDVTLSWDDLRALGVPIRQLCRSAMLISCPDYRLAAHAVKLGLQTTIRPLPGGNYEHDFRSSQFLRGAPCEPLRLPHPQQPLPRPHYFDSSDPLHEPLCVISHAERMYLLDDLISRPVNTVPDARGYVDRHLGGAGIFFRRLKALGILQDIVCTHKAQMNETLYRSWALAWRTEGWRFWCQPTRWFAQVGKTTEFPYYG